jgi:hypothetical protein
MTWRVYDDKSYVGSVKAKTPLGAVKIARQHFPDIEIVMLVSKDETVTIEDGRTVIRSNYLSP